MTSKDALMFPLTASAMLFGLYLLFRFFGKEYINYLFSLYFVALGTYAVWGASTPVLERFCPKPLCEKQFHFAVPNVWPLNKLMGTCGAQLGVCVSANHSLQILQPLMLISPYWICLPCAVRSLFREGVLKMRGEVFY